VDYWDTSALLKLYVREADLPRFLDLLAREGPPLLTAEVAKTEVLCALYRKEHLGDLKPGAVKGTFEGFLEDVGAGRIVTVPNGEEVLREAARLVERAYLNRPPVVLRSLDTLHLASALALRARRMVATDRRLREAAGLGGLSLFLP